MVRALCSSAMKLYVCYGTSARRARAATPAATPTHALREAGHDPEVVKAYGLAILPDALANRTVRPAGREAADGQVDRARPRARRRHRGLRLQADRGVGAGEPRRPVTHFICETCGVQFSASEAPPASCPVCEDERQYVARERPALDDARRAARRPREPDRAPRAS